MYCKDDGKNVKTIYEKLNFIRSNHKL